MLSLLIVLSRADLRGKSSEQIRDIIEKNIQPEARPPVAQRLLDGGLEINRVARRRGEDLVRGAKASVGFRSRLTLSVEGEYAGHSPA